MATAAPATPPSIDAAVEQALADHVGQAGALLPIFHAIQDRLGYVPRAAIPRVADALNLSRAEVHGVLTFYHDFKTAPGGRHKLRLCQAEACQSMGSERSTAQIKTRLGIDFHQTTADGAITLEPVYCLGNCALSPALMVDDRLYGRMTPERFEQLLLDELENA